MFLYLIQHGEAVDKEIDPDRPLSESGRRNVQRVAELVSRAGVTVPVVWHSGKTRARQSAEIVAQCLGGTAVERRGLGPKDDPEDARRAIEDHGADVAVVGHLPHLSHLAALLLRTKGNREPVAFQRGGIVAMVQLAPDEWQLRWIVTPELLT